MMPKNDGDIEKDESTTPIEPDATVIDSDGTEPEQGEDPEDPKDHPTEPEEEEVEEPVDSEDTTETGDKDTFIKDYIHEHPEAKIEDATLKWQELVDIQLADQEEALEKLKDEGGDEDEDDGDEDEDYEDDEDEDEDLLVHEIPKEMKSTAESIKAIIDDACKHFDMNAALWNTGVIADETQYSAIDDIQMSMLIKKLSKLYGISLNELKSCMEIVSYIKNLQILELQRRELEKKLKIGEEDIEDETEEPQKKKSSKLDFSDYQ